MNRITQSMTAAPERAAEAGRRVGPLSALLAALPGRFELPVLLLIGVLASGVWGFAELAEEVLEGETRQIDETLLLMLRAADDPAEPLGPVWLEETGRDFTALGGVGVLVFITAAAIFYLVMQGRGRAALFVLVAIASGMLLSTLMKMGFDRPRPDLVPHGAVVYTASFPSGHSMMSAITYLTLGALLARVQPLRRLKVFVLSVAVTVTLLVGLSRIYLGVHWPTDVLAGWTAGACWASLCWLGLLWVQRRGALGAPGTDALQRTER